MTRTLLPALLLAAATVSLVAPASADNCKRPNVVVKNDRDSAIKVSKIQYYDTCDRTWRTEDVGTVEIRNGSSHTFTDDLEYVGNCAISKFKLYRATRQGTGSAYSSFSWGGELAPDQGSSQRCNTGVTFTVHAHQ